MMKSIEVCESGELPGEYVCGNVGVINGSAKLGDVVLCLECLELLDRGAQVVGEGFWLKQEPRSPRGWQRIASAVNAGK